MERKIQKNGISIENKALLLALMAAVASAVYKTMDNITVHNFIVAKDGLTAAFAYLIVGGWTGLAAGICFALLMGKKLIDKDFDRIVLKNKAMHVQALIAGGISSVSVLFMLWGNQYGDPSMLIALGNVVIVYAAFYDVITKQAPLKQLLVPLFLVVIGGMLTSFSGSLKMTMLGIAYVLLISNVLRAVAEIAQQKGARASDGVSLFIWRFFWLATTGTALSFIVSAMRNKVPLLIDTVFMIFRNIPGTPFPAIFFVILTMFFVFLSVGTAITLKKTHAVSVIMLISTVQQVVSYPITFFGNLIVPGLFGTLPTAISIWIVRLLGTGLMIWGIYYLRRSSKKTALTSTTMANI